MKKKFKHGKIVQLNMTFYTALEYLKAGYIISCENVSLFIVGDDLHIENKYGEEIINTGSVWGVNELVKKFTCEKCGFSSIDKEQVKKCELSHYSHETSDIKYFYKENQPIPYLITLIGTNGKYRYKMEGNINENN